MVRWFNEELLKYCDPTIVKVGDGVVIYLGETYRIVARDDNCDAWVGELVDV